MNVRVLFDEKRINRILKRFPVEVQIAGYDGGLRPAANIVKSKAEQLAPRSSQTGSSKKWSAKTRASRAGVIPLHRSIKTKLKRPGQKSPPYAVVGPKRPDGNIAHFVSPLVKNTRQIVLWGKRTGRVARKDDDFMRRAFDTTRAQQKRAFTRGVIVELRKRMKGIDRG